MGLYFGEKDEDPVEFNPDTLGEEKSKKIAKGLKKQAEQADKGEDVLFSAPTDKGRRQFNLSPKEAKKASDEIMELL